MKIIKKTVYFADEFETTFKPIRDTIKLKKTKKGYEMRYLTASCDDSDNPREWDNIGKMVCFHTRYALGDNNVLDIANFEGWKELADYLIKEENAAVVFPLFLYDHSGISISTGKEYPFNCRWDSSQVGFIYVDKDTIKAEKLTKDKARKILQGEVLTYNQYLTGDVYIMVKETYDKKKNSLDYDTLSGCYGYDEALESLEKEI